MTGGDTDRTRTAAPWLLVATVALTALNLRPAVSSVGAVLRDVQAGVGMSDTVAGVLTTLPVVSFGIAGLVAGRLGRRLGTERALVVALVLLAGGLAARVTADSPAVLVVLSAVALVGAAIGNVLVPVAVKGWFPTRVGRVTGVYSMAIALGAAVAAAVTVPIAELAGSWRAGLGVWALPVVVALVPWLVVLGGRVGDDGDGATRHPSAPAVPLRRSARAWGLTGFFGLQSLEAYVALGWLPTMLGAAGVPPATAGLLLAVTIGIEATVALLLPELASRQPDQRPWVVVLAAASLAAYLGLVLAPSAAPLAWAVLLGIGLGAFPLALTLIGLRAATAHGTSALSAMSQGYGYLAGAAGPLTIGLLHDLTGGWTVPLWVLVALVVPKLLTGWIAARPGYVDVEVRATAG